MTGLHVAMMTGLQMQESSASSGARTLPSVGFAATAADMSRPPDVCSSASATCKRTAQHVRGLRTVSCYCLWHSSTALQLQSDAFLCECTSMRMRSPRGSSSRMLADGMTPMTSSSCSNMTAPSGHDSTTECGHVLATGLTSSMATSKRAHLQEHIVCLLQRHLSAGVLGVHHLISCLRVHNACQ